MKTLAKRLLTYVHLHRQARGLYRWVQRGRASCSRGLYRASRILRRTDSRIAARYLATATQPKLHVGCGGNVLDGWLNSDFLPQSARVLRLDVTRRFPFAADTFAYVYSEHMIGSLPFKSLPVMLSECLRVLAPGGKVRITAVDLAFLVDLYGQKRSSLHDRYVEWRLPFYFDNFIKGDSVSLAEYVEYAEWASAHVPPAGAAGFVINNLMRACGIAFVYDEPILRRLLENAGFADIARCDRNQSGDAALRHLPHNRPRMPEGFLQLESFTLEGSKPHGVPPGSAVR